MSRMAITAIDTLRYARRLKDAGVPSEQAEAMADAIGTELAEQLATRADLEALENRLNQKLSAQDIKITSLAGSLRLVQWMLGFVLAFAVAIVWRVFV